MATRPGWSRIRSTKTSWVAFPFGFGFWNSAPSPVFWGMNGWATLISSPATERRVPRVPVFGTRVLVCSPLRFLVTDR